ncbi:MAG: tryptophan synthase subunit alpha [Candidatus Dadabacteria bacterium]|nr:tryptophan synthase subunit alpha [Candidatus Dadabacteria bacterium]
MGRIKEKFRELREKNKAALICYVTAGDPDIDLTEQIIDHMEASGVDMVEIGIPFSDPMADGPVIQAASERALANSTSVSDVLSLVKRIRSRSDIPVILFGYYNPFFSYGTERFARDAREAGADGVLVVDLPPEEAGELSVHAEQEGLDRIFLLAPTSTEERIEMVSQNASGFIYVVSVTGVTGARPDMDYDLEDLVGRIKRRSELPVGVGFGVSSALQAAAIASFSDAVIVGSALVRIIESGGEERQEMLGRISSFTEELSAACYR